MHLFVNCVFVVILLSKVTIEISAQAVIEGTCKSVTSMLNVNTSLIDGTWYGIRQYNTEEYGLKECLLVKLNNYFHDAVFVGAASFKDPFSGDTIVEDINYTPRSNSLLSFTEDSIVTSQMRILQTDYHGYAIVYSCNQINGTHNRQIVHIFGRARDIIERPLLDAIDVHLQNYDFDADLLIRVDQNEENCPDKLDTMQFLCTKGGASKNDVCQFVIIVVIVSYGKRLFYG